MKPKIAVSVGDINGIGLEILLSSHKELCKICEPFYMLHSHIYKQALEKLNFKELEGLNLVEFNKGKEHFKALGKNHFSFTCDTLNPPSELKIKPSSIDAKSGAYSFASFKAGVELVKAGHAKALITLPIHKKAWSEAGLKYRGHTEALREFFNKNAIMMLGCSKLFVGLFTEHIPLREVSQKIKEDELFNFLLDFYQETLFEKIGVLAFNPHAGDFKTIGGEEEEIIVKAIKRANKALKKAVYLNEPIVADTAFTPKALKNCKHLVSLYHDLALAPLKALYFEESINVSLNLPIIRTSVDHGTAFDIAYKKQNPSNKSYIEAVKFALYLAEKKKIN